MRIPNIIEMIALLCWTILLANALATGGLTILWAFQLLGIQASTLIQDKEIRIIELVPIYPILELLSNRWCNALNTNI